MLLVIVARHRSCAGKALATPPSLLPVPLVARALDPRQPLRRARRAGVFGDKNSQKGPGIQLSLAGGLPDGDLYHLVIHLRPEFRAVFEIFDLPFGVHPGPHVRGDTPQASRLGFFILSTGLTKNYA